MDKLLLLNTLNTIQEKMRKNVTEWHNEIRILSDMMEQIANEDSNTASGNDTEGNPEEYVEIEYSYRDEFGQRACLKKTFLSESLDDGMNIDLLLEEFRCFLLGAGFSPQTVAKIEMKD